MTVMVHVADLVRISACLIVLFAWLYLLLPSHWVRAFSEPFSGLFTKTIKKIEHWDTRRKYYLCGVCGEPTNIRNWQYLTSLERCEVCGCSVHPQCCLSYDSPTKRMALGLVSVSCPSMFRCCIDCDKGED